MSACADVRVCSKDTRLSVKEVDIGLAADIGTLSRLPKLVGNHSWVKDVCLSARIFGAEEALAVGLVSHVYETKAKSIEAAVQWATLVASKSPVAVQGTKELLNHARDHTVADSRKQSACTHEYSVLANCRTTGLRYTSVWNSAMLQTADLKAAFKSGLEKTKPRFAKL